MSKVIFTNGCFDVLHHGHFKLLEFCSNLGAKLIVGINCDATVSKLKGSDRPVNSQDVRRFNLECIRFVDEVVVFEEDTPLETMKLIKPDIIVKGGDYDVDSIVGSDIFDTRIFKYVDGFSTTKQLKRIACG
jgi:D-beta-D-heptose 7-phosphate kinase/D-beta-D-heptose 1-phosphate adenosyltransferase